MIMEPTERVADWSPAWGVAPCFIDRIIATEKKLASERVMRSDEELDQLEAQEAEALALSRESVRAAGVQASGGRHDYTVSRGVATVRVDGLIGLYSCAWYSHIRNAQAPRISSALMAAVKDPGVAGVILEFGESWGGSTPAFSMLASVVAAMRVAKPIVAYVRTAAAGGAFDVAAQCCAIYGAESCEVGAIASTEMLAGFEVRPGGNGLVLPTFISHRQVAELALLTRDRMSTIKLRRPRLDAELESQLIDGLILRGEQAQRAGLIDDLVSFEVAIDRVARGDVDDSAVSLESVES